jgi:hypothetical protein
MEHDKQVEWLFRNSGPILRYRIAVELVDASGQEHARLLGESLATPEVQRWLYHLGKATAIHGSRDSHAENAFAKLLDYGLHRGIPEFARSAEHLLAIPLQMWDPLVLLPFLVRGDMLIILACLNGSQAGLKNCIKPRSATVLTFT